MPELLKRGIDHVVLAVRDLEAARARFERMGFTTTPRADHPFGTSNSLVQLQGNFIELLAVTDPAKVAATSTGRFSFGGFNADLLARREGMTMLVFASGDARRDLAEFHAAQLTTHGPVDFSRQATLPDGSQVTVAFSLAFVTDARLPEAAFFTCQQHAPEHFWKPEYQRHANAARQIAEVTMVAAAPQALADLFGKLQRPEQVRVERGSLVLTTARGTVSVLTAAGLRDRYPGAEPAADSPYFAAIRIAVQDPRRAEAALAAGGLEFCREGGRMWFAPAQAGGVILEIAS